MSSELRGLLDDASPISGEGITERTAPPAEPSATVLTTDRWTRRAGARLADSWREALADVSDGLEPADSEANEALARMCDPNVAADAIETLLSSAPTLAERPESEHRAKWWKGLMDAPETTALRARTVANATIAEIAAAELAKSWSQYVADHPEPAEGDGEGGGDESAEDSIARIRSVRSAIKSASESAEMAEAVGQGLGLGSGGAADAAQLARYTRKLKDSRTLAKIMQIAGRFAAKASRLQRSRSDLAGMEITGVELSGDISRVLPGELALIAGAVPELEDLALLQLVECRSLSYKRITRTPKAMGPIVISIDESGSMAMEGRIEAAKGLALAMAGIARAQKRPYMLVAWSDGPVRICRGEDGPDAIVEWLEAFQQGGTDLRGPLWEVTTEHWPEGKIGAAADHIIVTDGNVGVDQWLVDHYAAWSKGTSVRTFGIGIGIRDQATLAKVCDGGVWCMPSLDLDSPGTDAILSIGPSF